MTSRFRVSGPVASFVRGFKFRCANYSRQRSLTRKKFPRSPSGVRPILALKVGPTTLGWSRYSTLPGETTGWDLAVHLRTCVGEGDHQSRTTMSLAPEDRFAHRLTYLKRDMEFLISNLVGQACWEAMNFAWERRAFPQVANETASIWSICRF